MTAQGAQRSVIYIYRGTFDPFHKNHEAISRWCLAQPHTMRLVIHINYRPTCDQTIKQPASWETRFDIIHRVLKEKADIRPKESFDTTLDWIVETYGCDVETVLVLGSDVLEQVTDKPHIKSFAQHVRINAEIDGSISPAHLHNKPLLTIPLNLPPISSTQIRLLLLEGKLCDAATMLPTDALESINMTNDYSPLFISIRKLRKNRLFISSDSARKLASNFTKNSHLEDKTQQFKGLSGDAIFSVVRNNQSIAICKVFQLGAGACRTEVGNHRLFSQYSKTPLLYFTSDNMVCMKHIDGEAPQSVDDYRLIGKAYNDLHNKSLLHSEKICDESEALHLKENLAALCASISDRVLSEKIVTAFDHLLKRYIESPHKCATIHGDAQPGNVLIKADEVIFIDFGKVKQGEDPARDVNQMISSIYWKAWQNQMTEAADVLILKEHVNAFLTGYSYHVTTAADKFWSFYWHVRRLIMTLEKPELALSIDIRTAFNEVLNQVSIIPAAHRNSTSKDFLSEPFRKPLKAMDGFQERQDGFMRVCEKVLKGSPCWHSVSSAGITDQVSNFTPINNTNRFFVTALPTPHAVASPPPLQSPYPA